MRKKLPEMTRLFALIACVIFSLSVHGQTPKKIFLDDNWEECGEENANYYRLIEPKTAESNLYLVRDYYMNGTLQMEGHYSDEEAKIGQGKFLFYHENGKVRKDCYYVNDTLHDKCKTYWATGMLQNDETYIHGVLQGECFYYFQNGTHSSIEYYEDGKLVSFEHYNDDGSRVPNSSSADIPASFPGGREALYIYLKKNLTYPRDAVKKKIQGKVTIKFIIDQDGNVKEATVVKGMSECSECNEEALRVVSEMPSWSPGRRHNRPVNSYFNLPITFSF